MTIRMVEIPTHDRPRERLLREGVSTLSDAELVAMQLGSGLPGGSALDVARELLAEWGGVEGLARARPEELARTPGVGPAKASRLASAFGLAGRADAPSQLIRLRTSADIAGAAARLLDRARTERVVVLVADGAQRLRRVEVMATGTATACPMPVREIVATTLRYDGIAFAVAHNHPGGDPTPSAADRLATQTLRDAARATGLRFLDHVVIGGDGWRSAAA
jgi:DNA repair protein RadC